MLARLWRWCFPPEQPWQPTGYRYTTERTYDYAKAVAGKRRAEARETQRLKVEAKRPTKATKKGNVVPIRRRQA